MFLSLIHDGKQQESESRWFYSLYGDCAWLQPSKDMREQANQKKIVAGEETIRGSTVREGEAKENPDTTPR